MRRYLLIALFVCAVVAATAAAPATAATRTQDVLYVGNNWEGTADLINPHTFQRVARLNIIPDKDARMQEILTNPDRLAYFLAIRELVGEGHDQYVDDMFSSPDGRYVFVSRPSFADVVAFDLSTSPPQIVWRTPVEGYRSDHMAISPDGKRLVVSASTARKAHVIDVDPSDPKFGQIVGSFESGDSPHENNFSRDGSLIYHASIGAVYTPLDEPAFDSTKGERRFEIVDANTLQLVKPPIDMGKKLEEAGYSDMSSAVRPMALSPDEHYLYFQVSFFHGFVEYDLQQDKVLRLAHLPTTDKTPPTREQYLLDSAHHGLAMNPDGTKLCAAGTMDGYAAVVHRDTFTYRLAAFGDVPYWATNSGDGRYCFVSFAGDDQVSVISYAKEKEVARINVGDHPQRARMGKAPLDL